MGMYCSFLLSASPPPVSVFICFPRFSSRSRSSDVHWDTISGGKLSHAHTQTWCRLLAWRSRRHDRQEEKTARKREREVYRWQHDLQGYGCMEMMCMLNLGERPFERTTLGWNREERNVWDGAFRADWKLSPWLIGVMHRIRLPHIVSIFFLFNKNFPHHNTVSESV